MSTMITYGPGGYDPTKPNNNIVSIEQIEVEPQPPSHRGICWPGNYQHDHPTDAQVESTARLIRRLPLP